MFGRRTLVMCLLTISTTTLHKSAHAQLGTENFNASCSHASADCDSIQNCNADWLNVYENPANIISHSDNPWFVRFGVGALLFGESGTFTANDNVIPGAGLLISDEAIFAFDIGYQLSPKWTATISGGVPPKLDLDGTGPFEGISYGTTRFAPVVFALQRHFFINNCTSIYIGGGVTYIFQYETIDGLVENLDIDNNAGGVVQLGVERRINQKISLYADAKKAFYDTESFGNVGGAAVVGDITADSTALTFGIRYDF